jgi:hypothetical protein
MTNEFILIPSLQKKLENVKYSNHAKIISRLIAKLEKMGKNALKILDVEDYYLLCEMKVMRPPYRLYVVVDQKHDNFYVVDWEHKGKQEKTINELKSRLSLAIEAGLNKIFT